MAAYMFPERKDNPPIGALTPLGDYKGYGLALFCELFGGMLSGGGTVQPEHPRKNSIINNMFTILIDPKKLIDLSWMHHEIEEIVKNSYNKSQPVFNNVSQHLNHMHFWEIMKNNPNGKIPSKLENKINDVMSTNFKAGISNVWGIQYHPEITYNKMINLIHFRKDRLLKNQAFKDEDEINSHVKIIDEENKISNKEHRMTELKNWLNYLNAN